jgi:glycosyltransferase involved in cell wall biosynthesis
MSHTPPAVPKISIVTPSFNQAAFIEEALWSVKNQNYPNAEHIIFDGASTDGTVEILKRYSSQPGWEHLRWISELDRGQSDALNKGFQMASGDIIGWLNSDDKYRPSCFRTVAKAFPKHPQADILYGDYTWIDQTGRTMQTRREIEFSAFVLYYHRVLYIPTTSTFFRRRVFDEGNLIDIQYQFAMDYEFFLRLSGKGYRFQHIPFLLADFRWHAQSKSQSQSRKQLEEHDRIAAANSPVLQNVPSGMPRRLVLQGLRVVAAGRRYSEKLLRGYYFEQFNSQPPDR